MKKKLSMLAVLCAVATLAVLTTAAMKVEAGPNGQPASVVVFVTSQGLYYDSIVTADPLPPDGPFQLLEMGPNGLQTEFGPGDPSYLGGRWKEDFDGDGEFHYFECPLLPPGRENP